MARLLIVNADDFGLSSGVNRGIVQAHRHGIVTSTSLMVRMPAAPEAAALSREYPHLGVGLHLDFGEWAYRDGEWELLYEVVPMDDTDTVRHEVESQLAAFRRLMGRDPTHLDSHQHAHRSEPLRSCTQALAERLAIPLRHLAPEVCYCGAFYGQSGKGYPLPHMISAEALIEILRGLPEGVTELACHPGFDDGLNTMYRAERAREVETLCAPSVREAILELGIQLCSFQPPPRSSSIAG